MKINCPCTNRRSKAKLKLLSSQQDQTRVREISRAKMSLKTS
jgi:hypothetical protein